MVKYKSTVDGNIESLIKLVEQLTEEQRQTIERIAVVAAATLNSGGTIFWSGNGGSAADAQHLSAELIGRLVSNRKPLSSISLNSDIAAITCISNDFGFSDIYARQLEGVGKKQDFLIVLSTSGNSENIINCLKKARELGISTASLLGKGGGKARQLADHELIIASADTARIQEIHKFIGHTICQIIEKELGYQP
jgi:D-sedoheptulose 7-phosphate isomerase